MSNKILVVGPAWVGDMVMAQTLFKLLKQNQSYCSIDVLAPNWSLPLLSRMPEVSDTITMPLTHGQLDLKQRYKLGKSLQEKNYCQAIILPNSFKSALIPYFANIPKRTGWLGEMRFIVLNDLRILNKKKYPLMIERFMALGLNKEDPLPKTYPLPELITSPVKQTATMLKYTLSQGDSPILALCPGAEFGPSKRWPEAYYAFVANQKIKEGWQVWLLGSEKDRPVSQKIMAATHNQCINLTGKTTLDEAVDLLSLASIVISNDSGLMHIAAALKKPLIVIYGPTSASFTPPLHDKAKILSLEMECQPCFKRECPLKHQQCMTHLKPEKVLNLFSEFVFT